MSIHQSRSSASSSSFSSDFFRSFGNSRERSWDSVQASTFRYEQTYGGEGEHGLARNDRMPVESAAGHERASPLYRLSRITMEITTSLGSHTDSSCSFLCRPFRFLSRKVRRKVSVPLSFILLFASPLYTYYTRICIHIYTRTYAGVNACTREKAHVPPQFRLIALGWSLSLSFSPLATFLTVKLSLPRLRSARVNMKENSIVCKQAARFEAPGSVRWVRRVSMIENRGILSLSLLLDRL